VPANIDVDQTPQAAKMTAVAREIELPASMMDLPLDLVRRLKMATTKQKEFLSFNRLRRGPAGVTDAAQPFEMSLASRFEVHAKRCHEETPQL
jgi:hypothetical protein